MFRLKGLLTMAVLSVAIIAAPSGIAFGQIDTVPASDAPPATAEAKVAENNAIESQANADYNGIFRQIPAGCLAYIAAPQLNEFKSGLSGFISSFGQGMIPSDPVGMAMAQMGLFNGVDEAKGFAVVVLGQNFSGLSPEQLASPMGYTAMNPTDYPFAVIIGGAGAKEMFRLNNPTEQDGFIVFVDSFGLLTYAKDTPGGYVVFSPNPKAVDYVVSTHVSSSGSAATGMSIGHLAELEKTGIVISADTGALSGFVSKAYEAINATMSQAAMQTSEPMVDNAMAAFTKMAEVGLDVMSQVDKVDIALSFSADGVQVDKLVCPRASSELAGLLDSIRPDSGDLMVDLPKIEYAAAGSMNIGRAMQNAYARKMLKLTMDLSTVMFQKNMDSAKWDNLVSQMYEIYKGDCAFAVIAAGSDASPVFTVSRSRTFDMDKYMAYQRESITLMKEGLSDFYNSMGLSGFDMSWSDNVATVSGRPVSCLKMTVPTMPGQPAMDFGWNTQYFADAGNGVAAMATGDIAKIGMAISPPAALGKLSGDERIVAALKKMPENPFFFGVVNPKEVVEMVFGVVAASGATDPQFEMARSLAPQSSELVVAAANCDSKMMHGRLYIPSALFADIFRAVMMAKSQMNTMPSAPPSGF